MKLGLQKLIVVCVVLLTFTGCKKAIEAAKEQAVVDAITDGVWYVSKFVENNNNTTPSFTGWEFTYYSNGTSVANKTGNATVNGTWSGNASNFTFTAAFTTTPPAPLEKLAGTWTVTKVGSASRAYYARTVASITDSLELTKK